jgi:ActR/RegA family two-component response regulator
MKPRLLILDDDRANARALARCLKSDFYCVVAFSLAEAEASFSDVAGINALLTDWDIGVDTPVRLLGKVPTVVLTGNLDEVLTIEQQNTCSTLRKPADIATVLHALREAGGHR